MRSLDKIDSLCPGQIGVPRRRCWRARWRRGGPSLFEAADDPPDACALPHRERRTTANEREDQVDRPQIDPLTRVLGADDPLMRLRAEPFLLPATVGCRAGRRPRARTFPRLMRIADRDALGRARSGLGAHLRETGRRASQARQQDRQEHEAGLHDSESISQPKPQGPRMRIAAGSSGPPDLFLSTS
jgi:hypothetical protein